MFSPMRPGDYRREYAAYSSALARTLYDFHAGHTAAPDLAPLRERYADLWTRASIAHLEHALRDTAEQFETERAALQRLLAAARLGHADAHAREVADELLRCEAAQRVEWARAHLAAADVPGLLAHEPDAQRRRELSARWLDALATCDDLRAARLAALDEAAVALGRASYLALLHEAAQADETKLTAAADALVARTSETYHAHLRAWAARHLPPQFARTPAHADSLFFARLVHLDQFCSAADLRATYGAALAGVGIRVERQSNLRVEWKPHPARACDAACFALDPPTDVRLSAGARGRVQPFRSFFRAVGCAQQLAWVSPTSAARYPEFVHAPDPTTRAAYGFLFQYLLHDPAWLAAHRGLRASEAQALARAFALVELHDARRTCAHLHQQLTLAAATDVRADVLAAEYAARLTEATGFRYEPALHLHDTVGHMVTAAAHLRARLCAVALGEYLRTRHGRRWWATRAAGDELIDLWNTGARYTVEELAALVGAGAPDADMLADSLLAAVKEE